MKTNKGFSIVEAVLVIVVVAVVGFVGYMAYTNFLAPKDSTSDAANTSDNAEPVTVESTEDLDEAITALDDVSIEDESEGTELDSASEEFES